MFLIYFAKIIIKSTVFLDRFPDPVGHQGNVSIVIWCILVTTISTRARNAYSRPPAIIIIISLQH